MVKLSQIDNIVGIKDSSGDMAQAAEYIRRTEMILLFSWKRYLIYGFLAYGGKGAVASTANIVPQIVVKIYEEYPKREITRSAKSPVPVSSIACSL